MTMTPKQVRFVEEYLIDLNATQAALRAGYSEKTAHKQGSQLLGKTSIAAAISAAQANRSERTEITQDYVLNSIFSTMERCKQAEAVLDRRGEAVLVETPAGDLAPAYTFNAMGVFKGAELLGKHLGMFNGATSDDQDAPSLNITLTTAAPIGDVRVTRPKT